MIEEIFSRSLPQDFISLAVFSFHLSEPDQLFEILHHPDIAAARSEAVKQDPVTVRRPDWVIDPRVGVVELEDLFRGAAVER